MNNKFQEYLKISENIFEKSELWWSTGHINEAQKLLDELVIMSQNIREDLNEI